MQHKSPVLVILSAIFFLLLPDLCESTLHQSIVKHQDRQVVQEDINKIARFDEYIRYFTSFSYFVPKHKVSSDFVRALILAESGGDPKAVSEKKAIGLGQILVPTGVQAGKELGKSTTTFRHVSKETLNNLREEDLFDPAVNILLTCYLIAKYNYKFNGRLDLVVSAWNAGENTESLSYGKHAPYRETEDLIGKINAYYIYLLKTRTFRK